MSEKTTRFDRVPAVADSEDTPSRPSILAYWDERFGIAPRTFADHTFWERGRGKIWVFWGDVPDPADLEGLGMSCLRTTGRDWKPSTNAIQRFGGAASRNVIDLDRAAATRFVAGEDQVVSWDGDWGYVIVATSVASEQVPLGVGQYIDGELRSTVPKGRRRSLTH